MFIHVQSRVVILQAIRGPTMLPSDLDGEEQLRFLLEATKTSSDAESWTQDFGWRFPHIFEVSNGSIFWWLLYIVYDRQLQVYDRSDYPYSQLF